MTTNKIREFGDRKQEGGRTRQRAGSMLTAFHAKDVEKANSYYAPDAIIATAGRPAAKDARAVSKAIKDDLTDPNFKMILSHEKTEVFG